MTTEQCKALDILALHLYGTIVVELQQLRRAELQNIDMELYNGGELDEEKYRKFANYIVARLQETIDEPCK